MKRNSALSRRHFIQRIGGAAAACSIGPTIIPCSALGRGGVAAPSERMTLGFIGVGGQGQWNMKTFIGQNDTQVVALCDVEHGFNDRGLAPALANAIRQYEQIGRPIQPSSIERYGDYRELLAREDIDAVVICTPDHWHGLISIAAARAGKDIYCEKPLVNSIREGRAVCEAVEGHGRILQTGSHERSNETVRYAYELVRNGHIGELREIEVNLPLSDPWHRSMRENTQPGVIEPVPDSLNYDFWLGPAPQAPYIRKRVHMMWRFVLEYGGGEITDRGAHILDLAQFINDADNTGPVEIEAHGTRLAEGVYNCFVDYTFTCRYHNGVTIRGSCQTPRGLKLVGSKGWIFIHIHGGQLDAEPASILREVIRPHEIHTERSKGHQRNFLDCVRSRRLPIAYHEIGHRTATLCHLLNIAMIVDRPLKWDPKLERITNDPVAARMIAPPMRAPWRL